MRKIPLNKGLFVLVDNEDFDWLSRFTWHAHYHGGTFYARTNVRECGKQHGVYMHKLIMGSNADGMDIDHEDGDGWNNQRSNLRICEHIQNCRNRKPNKNCVSKFKGVMLHAGGKYRARIVVNGKRVCLGLFVLEEDAARAYDAAVIIHYGQFYRLNFPEK